MGKSKKSFIDKSSSQKFHLLYRSHTDGAYALVDGTVPSDYVLVAASQVNHGSHGIHTHLRRENTGIKPRDRNNNNKKNVKFHEYDDNDRLNILS